MLLNKQTNKPTNDPLGKVLRTQYNNSFQKTVDSVKLTEQNKAT